MRTASRRCAAARPPPAGARHKARSDDPRPPPRAPRRLAPARAGSSRSKRGRVDLGEAQPFGERPPPAVVPDRDRPPRELRRAAARPSSARSTAARSSRRARNARPALRRDAAGRDRLRRQPRLGIVGAQPQPIFGAGGEHPIGLGHALQDEVVDHHPDIAVAAVEQHRRRARRPGGGVQPGDQALRRRLLIAGGAVDLARQIKALDVAHAEAWARGCAGRHGHIRPHSRAAGSRARSSPAIERTIASCTSSGSEVEMPFGIDGRIVEPLRLEEDLMAVAVGEAVDLVLDRGAVTRPDAFDLAGEERRAVEAGADDVVGSRVGPGDRAEELRRRPAPASSATSSSRRRPIPAARARPSRSCGRRAAAGCRS